MVERGGCRQDQRRLKSSGNRLEKVAEIYAFRSNELVYHRSGLPLMGEESVSRKEEAKAVEALWNAIFQATRVDQEDPEGMWKKHNAFLQEKIAFS